MAVFLGVEACFIQNFFEEKINDFPRTFQGLKSFFQGLIFANNMK